MNCIVFCSVYNKIRDWFKGCHVVIQEKIEKQVEKINLKVDQVSELSDSLLQLKTMELRRAVEEGEIQLSSKKNDFKTFFNCEKRNTIIVEAMAVFAVAATRTIGLSPYNVQFFAAYILLGNNIAEMKTGEGKTIAIAIATYVKALFGNVHIVTANDYLVHRDAKEMGQIYSFLGLTTGVVDNDMPPSELKKVYDLNIVYGTGSGFVFSYLKNTLAREVDDIFLCKNGLSSSIQKNNKRSTMVIVDEVDSILIDEARTPLIISGVAKTTNDYFALAKELVSFLEEGDIDLKIKDSRVVLLDQGIVRIEDILRERSFFQKTESLMDNDHIILLHYINNALQANYICNEGKDYMIDNGKLLLIDNVTGRVLHGRSYSAGLHQAIQVKHDLQPDPMNRILASMTYDYYFAKYDFLAGTSGTASHEAKEFKGVYGLDVFIIPTNVESQRKDHDDLIFCTMEERDKALIDKVKEYAKEKRPVLLYTLTENDSDKFSTLLKRNKIKHQVLNAKNHEKEAYIIAQAGRSGKVTVVTNMAGRGTDILLGGNHNMLAKQAGVSEDDTDRLEHIAQECATEKEKVKELGGLAIIAAGRNDNRRLDDQMSGRAGRQGEAGSSIFFISLNDGMFSYMGKQNIEHMQSLMKNWGGMKKGEAVEDSYINSAILTSQKSKEASNRQMREGSRKFMHTSLIQLDKMFDMRLQILFEKNIYDIFKFNIKEEILALVSNYVNESTNELDNVAEMVESMNARFKIDMKLEDVQDKNLTFVVDLYVEELIRISDELKDKLGDKFDKIVRQVYLKIIDELWVNHINELDILKQVISLRAYGQKDVEVEYQKEAYDLFLSMLENIRGVFVTSIVELEI